MSLADAREKRDEAKKLLRDGVDPWDHKVTEDLASVRAMEQAEEAERRRARRQSQTVAWLVDQFCTVEAPRAAQESEMGRAAPSHPY